MITVVFSKWVVNSPVCCNPARIIVLCTQPIICQHKFTGKHTDLVNSAQLPLSILSWSDEKISAYNGDAKNKEDLRKAMHTMQAQHHSVYELTVSRLRYLALLRHPTRLDFAMSEMKSAPTQALNFISSAPGKIAILMFQRGNKKKCVVYASICTCFFAPFSWPTVCLLSQIHLPRLLQLHIFPVHLLKISSHTEFVFYKLLQ